MAGCGPAVIARPPRGACESQPAALGEGGEADLRLERKYVVALVSVFGMYMNLLDLTIVNVAVPVLTEALDATTSQLQGVVTAYLISVAVFIPVSGWAGDPFGHEAPLRDCARPLHRGSALCAAARLRALRGRLEYRESDLFRALQGIGGGLLMPVAQTMVFRSSSRPERAAAAGILVVPTTIAPASGPLLGGLILDHLA